MGTKVKFTALPVKVGDSFLLETPSFKMLVDGGMNQKHIVRLLNNKRVPKNHINILVCTHYDTDHINGIVGLLKSKYTFDEIWMPEIFGSLSHTVTQNIECLKLLFEERYDLFDIEGVTEYEDKNIGGIENDNSFELIDVELLSALNERYGYYYFVYPLWKKAAKYSKMFLNLKKINEFIIYSLGSGAYIRWFRYTGKIENMPIRDDILAVNSKQTSISEYRPEFFLKYLYLTTTNKQSLVFCYKRNGDPNVLFTSDSDLSFFKTPIMLSDNSIVTAPHHGSEENNLAYANLGGSSLIFIRSDRSQTKRPGQGFLQQSERYCTICRNQGPKREIEVVHSASGINKPAKKCTC